MSFEETLQSKFLKVLQRKNYMGLLKEVIQNNLWIKKVTEKIIWLFNLCFNEITLDELLSPLKEGS